MEHLLSYEPGPVIENEDTMTDKTKWLSAFIGLQSRLIQARHLKNNSCGKFSERNLLCIGILMREN